MTPLMGATHKALSIQYSEFITQGRGWNYKLRDNKMGNPWATLQEMIEDEINPMWHIRKWLNKKPKDMLEDLWRNGNWKFKRLR